MALSSFSSSLTLVLLILLPLCLWFTLSQRVKMRNANIEVKRKTATIFSALENGVSGIRTAKAFANEKLEEQKFLAANDLYRTSKTEYYRTMGLFMSGMEFTLSIMPLAVIAAGGFFIMQGTLSYIELVTFTLYVSSDFKTYAAASIAMTMKNVRYILCGR